MLVYFSLVLCYQIKRECWSDHDVRSSGKFKNLRMIEHFVVNNRSRSFIRLLLGLKIILVFRYFWSIFFFFVLTGIFINLVHSFLLIWLKAGSDEAIILKVWVRFLCHMLWQLDEVKLRHEIICLSLLNSLTENIILTRSFVLNTNRNIDFLSERIKILEWIFGSLGADEFF